MVKSAYLYSKFFFQTLFLGKHRKLLLEDMRVSRKNLKNRTSVFEKSERQTALRHAVDWLLHAQQMMKDDGFGSFHIVNGWTTSYPETSGYIIPSLLNYSLKYDAPEIQEFAEASADWLVSIQHKDGGWQGGRIADNWPPVIFNTGQVIRGLYRANKYFPKEQYLESMVKAADWLCDSQEENGSWMRNASMNAKRVYDTFVDLPLLKVAKASGNGRYRTVAIKNLDWVLSQQLDNAWFENCDNTTKHNDRPILHTIAYTIDGLIDCGIALKEEKYFLAGKKPADILLEQFTENGILNGRYDSNWKGSEVMMTTAGAQTAIIWFKLFHETGHPRYFEAASRMNDLLIGIQTRSHKESSNTFGALPGSFPIWGRYEPFAFPNWATKFFVDSLMLEEEVSS